MKTSYTLLPLFVLFGCTASQKLKQQKKLLEEQKAVKNATTLQQLHLNNKSILHDSTQTAYHVEIWPMGQFSYNLNSGFVGQAQHIQISGVGTKKVKSLNETTLTQREAKFYSKKIEVKNRSDNLNKEAIRIGTPKLLVVAVLLIGLAFAYYCFRRYS